MFLALSLSLFHSLFRAIFIFCSSVLFRDICSSHLLFASSLLFLFHSLFRAIFMLYSSVLFRAISFLISLVCLFACLGLTSPSISPSLGRFLPGFCCDGPLTCFLMTATFCGSRSFSVNYILSPYLTLKTCIQLFFTGQEQVSFGWSLITLIPPESIMVKAPSLDENAIKSTDSMFLCNGVHTNVVS